MIFIVSWNAVRNENLKCDIKETELYNKHLQISHSWSMAAQILKKKSLLTRVLRKLLVTSQNMYRSA